MSLDVKVLERLIKDSGVEHNENSVSWIFTCPRCNKMRRLYLRKRDGRFVCWKCKSDGYEGKPEFALRDLLMKPVRELQELLYGAGSGDTETPYVKLEIHDFFDESDEIPFELLPPLPRTAFPVDFYELDDPKAIKGFAYLMKRGVDLELAKKFDLRYHPQERRVVIPIYVDAKLVGWQARTIEKSEGVDENGKSWRIPKILTGPKSFDRERTWMFQDNLKDSDHAVLCEGPFDGIKCHLCGGVIVSMGKSVSPGQLEFLRIWADRVKERAGKPAKLYLAIDPDAASELTRLCRTFADLDIFHMVPPPPFEDFGAMSPDGALVAFLNARRINAGRVFIPPHVDFFSFSAAGQRLE